MLTTEDVEEIISGIKNWSDTCPFKKELIKKLRARKEA